MERLDFRDQISRNKRKSTILMVSILLIIVILGYVISLAFNPAYFSMIMIIATIISVLYVYIGFYNSEKMAIASVGAKKADRTRHKQFYSLVEGLTIASGLPMPKLYVMKSDQINAFASGRDPKHAVVCVTEGALKKLNKEELEGVLAHELGHIRNYDIRYITLVTVLVGMISIISQIFLRSLWFGSGDRGNDRSQLVFILLGILLAILAPIVVYFVQMSISRKREFAADASAVQFTRYPRGLINALKKIKQENIRPEKKISRAVAPLFISDPFLRLGRTHPPIDKRIEALERM
ncbi:zinc metalloprotease HtpX [Candidatus Pacearchaeota archaeon ex4484_71]|nr:MAG: zinc metalloprotease HtpX [Candidatus Pacearchaeota archaeon ex4484_71]